MIRPNPLRETPCGCGRMGVFLCTLCAGVLMPAARSNADESAVPVPDSLAACIHAARLKGRGPSHEDARHDSHDSPVVTTAALDLGIDCGGESISRPPPRATRCGSWYLLDLGRGAPGRHRFAAAESTTLRSPGSVWVVESGRRSSSVVARFPLPSEVTVLMPKREGSVYVEVQARVLGLPEGSWLVPDTEVPSFYALTWHRNDDHEWEIEIHVVTTQLGSGTFRIRHVSVQPGRGRSSSGREPAGWRGGHRVRQEGRQG